MPTFATPVPIAATVEVAGAHVRVTASERTDTMVLVEPINPASPSDVKVAEKTKVYFAGGRLSVKTTKPGAKRGSVAITIELPAGSGLAAYLAHSSVQVDGPLGRCELHMATGQVRLDRIDTLKANIASGEVAIGHIAGRADIDGGAFRMRIGGVEDAVALSNSGGQVWIGHASAGLDLGSASCDFDIDRAGGSITANTASGAIRIGRMTHGRAKLMNDSGNIEIGISEGAAASIDVNSERGAVHNYVSSQAEPGASDPKVAVFARTRHGDIIIQRVQRADRHEASVISTS
jgi:Putative adhesin